MKELSVSFTTNGSGAASEQSTQAILGKLYALEYRPTSIATGATLTVTCENGSLSHALLTKASAGTSVTLYYPRDLVHGVADGVALTGTSGGDRAEPVLNGYVKVVIASGGDTKIGSVVFYYE
jgi:hypothetical protein